MEHEHKEMFKLYNLFFCIFFVENEENVSINLRFYNSGNFKLELNDGF